MWMLKAHPSHVFSVIKDVLRQCDDVLYKPHNLLIVPRDGQVNKGMNDSLRMNIISFLLLLCFLFRSLFLLSLVN